MATKKTSDDGLIEIEWRYHATQPTKQGGRERVDPEFADLLVKEGRAVLADGESLPGVGTASVAPSSDTHTGVPAGESSQ